MTSMSSLLKSIQADLGESTVGVKDLQFVMNLHGGDINRAALIQSGEKKWFLKYHSNAPAGMFETEATALAEISKTGCIRVPEPIAWGIDSGTSWLVLEYLDLVPDGPASLLGEQLAAMHRLPCPYFGWSHDNYIGSTPQLNHRSDNWAEFWHTYRLRPQLEMARSAGFGARLFDNGERLLAGLHHLLNDHQPAASLLHGDLWSGNKAFTTTGQPVIYDPASYYGDRETDIAMTELFGGFGPEFYAAYKAHLPLSPAYPLRRDLYKLYHVLNHLNLFGSAYLSQSEGLIEGLLSQIK
jgi:protein-ribulosamine 3-kinase